MKAVSGSSAQLIAVMLVQFFCLIFLVFDETAELAGLDEQESFAENHYFELLVIVALVLSFINIGRQLRRLVDRKRGVLDQLKIASGAFHELMKQNFYVWDLKSSLKDFEILFMNVVGIM